MNSFKALYMYNILSFRIIVILIIMVVYYLYRGVLPSPLRKKLLERAHQKSKKSKDKDRSSTSDIITGQQVTLHIRALRIACSVANQRCNSSWLNPFSFP